MKGVCRHIQAQWMSWLEHMPASSKPQRCIRMTDNRRRSPPPPPHPHPDSIVGKDEISHQENRFRLFLVQNSTPLSPPLLSPHTRLSNPIPVFQDPRWSQILKVSTLRCTGGGQNFAGGIFRCGKFRFSNVCEISRSIFRPLCEINPARNLANGAHARGPAGLPALGRVGGVHTPMALVEASGSAALPEAVPVIWKETWEHCSCLSVAGRRLVQAGHASVVVLLCT